MNTLLLLSGGLDSALLLHRYQDQVALCVGVHYGQPHEAELKKAEALAKEYDKPFEYLILPTIPKVNHVVFAARNAVLVSHAAAMALARGLDTVMIGCNASDWQDFPDCRPAMWDNLRAAFMAAYGVTVSTPLVRTIKSDIVAEAKEAGLLEKTLTCYAPIKGEPCGECFSCQVRKKAGG